MRVVVTRYVTKYEKKLDNGLYQHQQIILEVESDDKIEKLKEMYQNKTTIPSDSLRFVFGGKQLADSRTVSHYNIQKNSEIHMVQALRGA